MKNFNITSQSKSISIQAIWKEYIDLLKLEVDSLHQYIKYYNPEWRILKNDKISVSYYNINNDEIKEDNIVTTDEHKNKILNLNNLNFRWGFQNRTTDKVLYGLGDNQEKLNVGATIFKIDSYDVSSIEDNDELLSHFIVYESALAQYYNWTISTQSDEIVYNYFSTNESDYGLNFFVQLAKSVPRYYCDDEYTIKHSNEPYSGDGHVFDWTNPIEVEDNDYNQGWQGATALLSEVVYGQTIDNNTIYEDVICDAITYQKRGQQIQFSVFLDKTDTKSIEENFYVIFN